MVFKVLYGFYFLNQSSLRLAFPLGVLYLFLGNFTLWPGRIPLSPMYISKQALNRFTPVEFFQSQPKGRVSGVCVSPRMKMIISVLITHWPGSSLDFFWGVSEVKKPHRSYGPFVSTPFLDQYYGLSPVRNIRVHSHVIWPKMLLLGDKIRVDFFIPPVMNERKVSSYGTAGLLALPDTLCLNFKRATFNGISSIKYYRVP